jgi:hypothetical protein
MWASRLTTVDVSSGAVAPSWIVSAAATRVLVPGSLKCLFYISRNPRALQWGQSGGAITPPVTSRRDHAQASSLPILYSKSELV